MKKNKTDKLTYFQCVRFLFPFLSRLKVQCILFYLGCLFEHMQEIEAEDMANQNYGDLMVMIRWYTMDCVHFFVRDITILIII